MLDLSTLLAGGGSPPQFQDFTTSGTFTPSTKLLEKGGTVMVVLFGGGSGGGSGAGHGAVPKVVFTKVTGPVSVVIGAGGLANTTSGAGNSGGTSSFGAITAPGAPGNTTTGAGGTGAASAAFATGHGGIGLILPGIGAACGGGSHNVTSGAVAEAYGGGYNTAHAPANLGGGGGSSGTVSNNKNGGSGRCFVIWWE